MTDTVLRWVPALLVALLASSIASPGAAALHEQGPDQEDDYVFSREYPPLAGEQRLRDWFPVHGTEDGHRILCYVRTVDPGLAGTWSATLYDDLDLTQLHESGAWSNPPGPVVESVAVPVDAALTDPEWGSWTLQVRATGLAPETHVWIEWVGSFDECGHPPS